VPESTYRLNHSGKKELRLLLSNHRGCRYRASHGQQIWNRTDVEAVTGLKRDTVGRILPTVDPSAKPDDLGLPVQESTLIQLFRKLGSRRSEADLCKYWDKQKEQDESVNITQRPKQLATLLRQLDYEHQAAQFKEGLKPSPGVAAFLIPAPCDLSQQWAINRLVFDFNNIDRALRTPLINVGTHAIRFHGVDELWRQLAGKLKIKNVASARRDEVLRQLSQTIDRPVIIGLYNFGQDSALSPQDVIIEFWLPLIRALSTAPSRTARSQIALLIADGQIPDCQANHVTALLPLTAIESSDVEDWLGKKEVYRWCCGEFGRGAIEKKIQNDRSEGKWRGSSPGYVLDQICFSFGLNNGIQDLRRHWEWS
jgi:inactive STAND